MNLLGNILWMTIGGGLFTAALWCLFGALACLSVAGLPWGRSCFVMAGFVLHPFGRISISRELLTGERDLGTGMPGTIGNIIWFIAAGIWIALGHVAAAVPLAASIIGIPFAWQHLKLAGLALAPVGKTIVSVETAEAARRMDAENRLRAGRAS